MNRIKWDVSFDDEEEEEEEDGGDDDDDTIAIVSKKAKMLLAGMSPRSLSCMDVHTPYDPRAPVVGR